MKVFISHQSAYAYWDQASWFQRALGLSRVKHVSNLECGKDAIDIALKFGLDAPLHVLVPNANQRRTLKHAQGHVWSGEFQYGDMCTVDNSILIASPEFTFYLISKGMTLSESALLALEMCGGFSTHWPNDGYVKRPPLTTVEKLRTCFAKHREGRTRSQSTLALNWITDGSMSPMESKLLLALCLPPRYGGFGIPLPTMNPEINYNDIVSSMTHTSFSEGDLVWEDSHLIVEYNSNERHTGGARIAQDARRANGLKYAGYNVITVTTNQMKSLEDITVLARQISRFLGKRFKPKTPAQHKAQLSLYKTLFPWWDYVDFY